MAQDFMEDAQAIDPPAEIAEAWETIIGSFAEDPDADRSLADEERLEQLSDAGDQIEAYLADECGDLDLDTPAPWGDVDVCSLVPDDAVSEALPDAGVAGAEATPQLPTVEGCRWGDPSGPYVQVELWDPVDPQEFMDPSGPYEEHAQIAGHTAYVDGVGRYCTLIVDSTEYWLTVDVSAYPASARDVDACTIAADMATIALSSLP